MSASVTCRDRMLPSARRGFACIRSLRQPHIRKQGFTCTTHLSRSPTRYTFCTISQDVVTSLNPVPFLPLPP
jgi:hypothetical protein